MTGWVGRGGVVPCYPKLLVELREGRAGGQIGRKLRADLSPQWPKGRDRLRGCRLRRRPRLRWCGDGEDGRWASRCRQLGLIRVP